MHNARKKHLAAKVLFSVLGYFAVMLRQASFFALVEYRKSILPQQKIRLPCLTAKFLQPLPTHNSPLPVCYRCFFLSNSEL